MIDPYTILRPLAFCLPPETAHEAAIAALKRDLVPAQPGGDDPSIALRAFGLDFPNPIGMAAGFDKNAEALPGLSRQGFGFVECGTVTPRPQAGNPRPRLFRLLRDRAIVNRLGFNNHGLHGFIPNLMQRPAGLITGANIGKNKDSSDTFEDYMTCLRSVAPHCDYVTVNISSPNTPGLRDLQSRETLQALLEGLNQIRERLPRRVPLLVKLAPDLDAEDCGGIAETLVAQRVDGIILTNTTIARPASLRSIQRGETGGLSGAPLFEPSTRILARFYRLTGGTMPLIGVGGVGSAEQAYAKIRAGASLVQLYSALVYDGFGLVTRIRRQLPKLLARDGFTHITQAIGVDAVKYN